MVWYLESLTASIIPNAPLRIKPKLAPAWGADVVSSNIVGYSKLSTASGLNLIGIQFQPVGGNGEACVNDIMSSSGLVGYNWDTDAIGDVMYIFDPATQGYSETYMYAGDQASPAVTGLEWDLSGKWMNADLEPIEEKTDLGDGVWIQTKSAVAFVTVSGEVTGEVQPRSLSVGLNMVANPYPDPWDINSATYTGLKGYNWDTDAIGDVMYIFDSATQGYSETYMYAGDNASPAVTGLDWDLSGKWMDADLKPIAEKVPVGGATWIQTSSTSATVTYKPLAQ